MKPALALVPEVAEPLKIIFLDIDGVLNSCWFMERLAPPHMALDMPDVDLENVKYLNAIIRATGAKVVLSSSWRKIRELKDVADYLTVNCGLRADIIDKTPNLFAQHKQRGDEIAEWLDDHPEVESFVILDDDQDMGELMPRLVWTGLEAPIQEWRGLTEKHVELAVDQLERAYRYDCDACGAVEWSVADFPEGWSWGTDAKGLVVRCPKCPECEQ